MSTIRKYTLSGLENLIKTIHHSQHIVCTWLKIKIDYILTKAIFEQSGKPFCVLVRNNALYKVWRESWKSYYQSFVHATEHLSPKD